MGHSGQPAPPPPEVKIGVVAKRLGISIRTIHMYERECLFIARKNAVGTRYFSERDVEWLMEIRRMIKTGIGIAGIRYILSLIPCWEINKCIAGNKGHCPVITDHTAPCWANKYNLCEQDRQKCRQCPVYDIRFTVGSIKNRLHVRLKTKSEIRTMPGGETGE